MGVPDDVEAYSLAGDAPTIINSTTALAALLDGPAAATDRRSRAGAAVAAGLLAEVRAWPLAPAAPSPSPPQDPHHGGQVAWYACVRPSRVPADVAPALVWRREEAAEGGAGGEDEVRPALPLLLALPSGPPAPFAATAAATAPPAGPASGGTLVTVTGPALAALAGDTTGVACAFGRRASATTSLPLRPSPTADGGGPWDAACEAPPWDLRIARGGAPLTASRVKISLTAPGGCVAAVEVGGMSEGAPAQPPHQQPFTFTFVPDAVPTAIAPSALPRGSVVDAGGLAVSVFLDRRPAPWGGAAVKKEGGGKPSTSMPLPSTDADAEAALALAFPSPLIRLVGAGVGGSDVDLPATWAAGGRALTATTPSITTTTPPSLRTGRHPVALSLDGRLFATDPPASRGSIGGGGGGVAVEVGGPDLAPAPALVLVPTAAGGNTTTATAWWPVSFELSGHAALPPAGVTASLTAALYGWAGLGAAPAVAVSPPALAWGGGGATPHRASSAVSLSPARPLCATCAIVVTATPASCLPSVLPGTPPAEVVIVPPGSSRAAWRRAARVSSPPLVLARPAPGEEKAAGASPPSFTVELTGPPPPAPLPIHIAYELVPRSGDAGPFFGADTVGVGGVVRGFATVTPASSSSSSSFSSSVTLTLPPIAWKDVPPHASVTLDVRLVRSWAVRPEVVSSLGRAPALTLLGVRPGECPPGWADAGGGKAAAARDAEDASFDGSAASPAGVGMGVSGTARTSAAAAAAGLSVLALQAAPPGVAAAPPLPVTLSGADDTSTGGIGSAATLSTVAWSLELGATVPAGVEVAVLCLAPAIPGSGIEVLDGEGTPLVSAGGEPVAMATAMAAVIAATVDGAAAGRADTRVAGRRRLHSSPASSWCAASGGRPWTLPLSPGQNEFAVVVTPAGDPRAWRHHPQPRSVAGGDGGGGGFAQAARASAARLLSGWGWGVGGGHAAATPSSSSSPPPPPTLWLTVVRLAEEGHARLAELRVNTALDRSSQISPSFSTTPTKLLLLCSDTDPASRACSPAEPLLLTLPASAESVQFLPRLAASGVAGVTLEVGGRVLGEVDDRPSSLSSSSSTTPGIVGVGSLRPGQRVHVPIVVTAEDGVTAAAYALALEREEEAANNGTAAPPPHALLPPPHLAPPSATPASPALLSARCARCPAGRASPVINSPSCGLCPPGTAASGPAAPACTPCPPGSFSRGWGADRCAPCVPGSFSPTPGARLCSPCPPNTTALAPGAVRCGDPARRTLDPDATPALVVSFELFLTGAALGDVPRRAGVDGSPGSVIGRLIAADTASAFACAPGDVSVSPVVAVSRRVLAVNVTAALATQAGAPASAAVPPTPAPGPDAPDAVAPTASPPDVQEEDPVAAAAALAFLSADANLLAMAADPDKFFGRTTAALGAHATPSAARPPTAIESVPRAVAVAARRKKLAAGLGSVAGLAVMAGGGWAAVGAARRRGRRGRRAAATGAPAPTPPPPDSASPPSSPASGGPARRFLVGTGSDE